MPVVAASAYPFARDLMKLTRSLLNDAGAPGLPQDVVSIQRAVNVVTVTTLGVHGLILGDQVTVYGISDKTYNGTFFVSAIINEHQFTYVQVGADSGPFISQGAFIAIGLGNVFTDMVLLPFLNSAYRVVQRSLAMAGQTTFKTDLSFFVVKAIAEPDPSVQVVINEATAPPNELPIDLLEPLALWERPDGTNSSFTEMVDVTNSGGLPSIAQTEALRMWEWRSDGIYFVGSVIDTQVRMRYRKALPKLTGGDSQLLIRNCEEAVSYVTAALAANSRGSELSDKYDKAGEDQVNKLISAATRQQQRVVRRRRPFRARRGSRGFYF